MHDNEACPTTLKTTTQNSQGHSQRSCEGEKPPHGITKRLTIYPNGDCNLKSERQGLGKYLPNGPEELRRLECARIRVGETEVVIHADEVNLDGTCIILILQRMHQEIKLLRSEVRKLKESRGDS